MSPIAQEADMDTYCDDGYNIAISPISVVSYCFEDISSDDLSSQTEGEMCFGCGGPITDRYLLKVNERAWHAHCLRCCVCQVNLDRHTSCFTKEDNIYCKTDYTREFGTKCSKCLRHIQSTDWVRRAKDSVYHLACFACDSCKRQLSTGEEFALQNDRVLCKAHYIEVIEGGPHSDDGGCQKQKTKRVRTTFSEDQVQVLQANFQLDSNPDGQDLERIAQITGLSKRVTQVWFQNSRARQKKHQQNKINNISPGSMTGPLTSVTCSMSPSPGACSHGTVSPSGASVLINNHHNNVMSDGNHHSNMMSEGMHHSNMMSEGNHHGNMMHDVNHHSNMMTPLSLSMPSSMSMSMSSPSMLDSWMTPCNDTSITFVS